MRTLITLLSIGVLVLAGCRSARRAPPTPVRAVEVVTAAPTPSGPTRLRYYDMKDFPITNGIMVVRATQPELKAIDQHLSGMRRILRQTEQTAVPAKKSDFTPVQEMAPKQVVQIHVVRDIVEALPGSDIPTPTVAVPAAKPESPQEKLLAILREGLGAEQAMDTVMRFQGTSTLVVRAPRATHERIAEILDRVRAELKADAAR